MRKEYYDGFASEIEGLFNDCEGLIDTTFKVTNASFMETLNGLDEETGAMLGGGMKIYKKCKGLFIKMARQQDEMYAMIKEIQDENLALFKQNKYLQQLLEDLNKKIDDKRI